VNATRAQLVATLAGSGFDFVDTSELMRMVDKAVAELVDEDLWEWRLTMVQPASGAPVAGLGPIQSVTRLADGQPVWPRRRDELQRDGLLFNASGTVDYYFTHAGAVYTRPGEAAAGDIEVAHFALHGWTNGGDNAADDDDTPIIPEHRRALLEAICRRMAHEFNGNDDGAQLAQAQVDRYLERARAGEELHPDVDEPQVITLSEDY
jgi:hypothetical protein